MEGQVRQREWRASFKVISHGSVTALWRQTQSFLGRKYCIGQIYISILCSWHYQKSMNIQFTPAGTAQATTFFYENLHTCFLISLILRKEDHASRGLTKYEYQHLSACFIDGDKKAKVFARVWATDWEKDRRVANQEGPVYELEHREEQLPRLTVRELITLSVH